MSDDELKEWGTYARGFSETTQYSVDDIRVIWRMLGALEERTRSEP